MNTPLKMLLIVLCVDAFFLLGNLSIQGINPNAPTFATYEGGSGHLINQFDSGGYNLENFNTSQTRFPDAQQTIGESDSGVFADIWNTIKGWVFDTTGLTYVVQIVGAPYYFLKGIFTNEAYQSIVFIIGAMWYAFSLFAVISWAIGRE